MLHDEKRGRPQLPKSIRVGVVAATDETLSFISFALKISRKNRTILFFKYFLVTIFRKKRGIPFLKWLTATIFTEAVEVLEPWLISVRFCWMEPASATEAIPWLAGLQLTAVFGIVEGVVATTAEGRDVTVEYVVVATKVEFS